jgi:peptide deformylase
MELIKIPDKRLRQKCKSIKVIDDNIKHIAEEMTRIMQENHGIGLAAPQVGELIRMIVINDGIDIVIINPEIKRANGTQRLIEGCLSIPDAQFLTKRPTSLVLYGVDIKGATIAIAYGSSMSAVISHEVDHVNGKLIDRFDRVSTIKSEPNMKLAWADK